MSRTRAEATTHALTSVIRTRRFWLSVARHSVPTIGVLAFGWAPMNIAVFFLLESWLYLTSRAAIEVTFDPHFAGADLPVTRWDAIRKTIWMLLLASVACGVLVVGFGGVMVLLAFPVERWRTFLAQDWKRLSFLVSLLGLAVDVIVDAIDLQGRLQDRTVAERRADDLRVRVMFYRVGALMVACLAIGLASSVGVGGSVLVFVISLILVYVDLFPRRLVKIFG